MLCFDHFDMSENNLGNLGCKDVAKMLMETPSIKTLNISQNNIGLQGLEIICQALTDPSCKAKLEVLDISRNLIRDEHLKILYSLVEMNESIESVLYTP
jgi:Ran GTPase-activating protein (RanGAP) involved in mRNA processing and transport